MRKFSFVISSICLQAEDCFKSQPGEFTSKSFNAGGKFTIYQPIILYRKFTADYIFTGGQVLQEPSVLITDEQGTVVEIVKPADAGDEITVLKGLLTPGFVNAHCHLELSHLKGQIAQATGLVEFLQQVMRGRFSSSQEMKMAAMENALDEMYQSGTVAVGDICNTADTIAAKAKSKLLWHNFIEVSGFVDAAANKRLADLQNVYDRFTVELPLLQTSFSPHAPYSVSKMLFQLLNNETTGQIITIHNQECKAEDELYKQKTGGFLSLYKNFEIDISSFEATGQSGFQSWLPYFNKSQAVISVHNTFTGEDDLSFAQYEQQKNAITQLYYCLCINANKYIEQSVPPINLLRKFKCNIVIGTDSYASNRQLNILEELKAISKSMKGTVPIAELLQWATLNGAKALGLDEKVGSFKKGKQPGIVIIQEIDHLNFTAHSFATRIL